MNSSFCPSRSRIWLFWGWYWTLGGHGTVCISHNPIHPVCREHFSLTQALVCLNSSDVTIISPNHNDGSMFIPRQNRNLREGSVASQRLANIAE